MSDLNKQFETIEQKLDKTLSAQETATQKAESVEKKLGEVEGSVKAVKDTVDTVKSELSTQIKVVSDEVELIKRDSAKAIETKSQDNNKSFNQILGETIERNAQSIQDYRKEKGEVSFHMMPELKEKSGDKELLEVKAVGDMSIAANFQGATATALTQDVRGFNQLIESPYNRVWLGDILPGGTSGGSSILYPKENGTDGGAALWTDPTADKPQMDFNITGQTAYFKWLAGIVIIERGMLDDIPFLISYLQNKMLISLKTAENGFILNGSADTNPVTGLNGAATAYNGALTSKVDRIVDAAYGQLVEDTFEFYSPTHTILTPRDAVNIGLNKASGSGEYDLPDGSVAFANGKLQVAGLTNVTTTLVGSGNFIALDARATMFVRRLQPELRMFEDAALAKKNKVMFRIEERATLAVFNNKAIVKGTLAAV
jgi:HK97 family phage major capsid protein